MDNLFSYDSKFFIVLGKVSNIVILNLLFLISCIPIITIGTSITATYFVAMKIVRDEEAYIVKEFIIRFKENFVKSTKIWFIMIATGIVLGFDYYISSLISNGLMKSTLQLSLTIVSIIFVFVLTYVFPITSKFENTIKNTIINSILISIKHLPQTILMVIINLSPIILIFILDTYWANILFLYTAIGFGAMAYINSILFNKIFEQYIG